MFQKIMGSKYAVLSESDCESAIHIVFTQSGNCCTISNRKKFDERNRNDYEQNEIQKSFINLPGGYDDLSPDAAISCYAGSG